MFTNSRASLEACVPIAADLLRADQADLQIIPDHCQRLFMDECALKDTPLALRGLPGLPWLAEHGIHKGRPGFKGMILYHARNHPHLRYVALCIPDQDGITHAFCIVAKGSIYRLARHFRRQEKARTDSFTRPILADGLLESIVSNSVEFLFRNKDIEKYNVRVRRGVMLTGEPGNGKTMVCRWLTRLCGEHGLECRTVSGGEIDRLFQSNELVDLFSDYPLLFFDDVDIAYFDRKRKPEIACAILTAMDGMNQSGHSVRIFTTNEEVGEMDTAFIRPGRIDRFFHFELPTADLRRRLVEAWPADIVEWIRSDRLFDEIVRKSEGYSFAELDSIKTHLVTDRLFGSNRWDVQGAFRMFEASRQDSAVTTNPLGFGAAQSQR